MPPSNTKTTAAAIKQPGGPEVVGFTGHDSFGFTRSDFLLQVSIIRRRFALPDSLAKAVAELAFPEVN
jgi:hypothetical protein